MVLSRAPRTPLAQLRPPYDRVHPIEPAIQIGPSVARSDGEALVWRLGVGDWITAHQFVRRRAAGTSLILVLPPAVDLQRKLIAEFDPARIINAGRLPGGL